MTVFHNFLQALLLYFNIPIVLTLFATYILIKFNKKLEDGVLKIETAISESETVGVLVVPANFFDRLFNRILGTSIISRNSLQRVLLISLLTNFAWLSLIIIQSPAEEYRFSSEAMIAIFLNIILFSICNFFGDFVSLTITRKVVRQIIATANIRYLAWDLLGVFGGYVITIIANLIIITSLDMVGVPPEKWFRFGIAGFFVSTWVLAIFMAGGEFWISFFGLMALLTITIPTVIYWMAMLIALLLSKQRIKDLTIRLLNRVLLVIGADKREQTERKVFRYLSRSIKFLCGLVALLAGLATYLSFAAKIP